jgi:hypothetical protein
MDRIYQGEGDEHAARPPRIVEVLESTGWRARPSKGIFMRQVISHAGERQPQWQFGKSFG